MIAKQLLEMNPKEKAKAMFVSTYKLFNTHILELSEWHELHDVTYGRLSRDRLQPPVVSVQNLHVCEVGLPHANDYYRHW